MCVCVLSVLGDLPLDDMDMMATAYRHPPLWYNPKVLGLPSQLLEPTFKITVPDRVPGEDAAGDVSAEPVLPVRSRASTPTTVRLCVRTLQA